MPEAERVSRKYQKDARKPRSRLRGGTDQRAVALATIGGRHLTRMDQAGALSIAI
jgi:hypothetical protein